MGDVVDFTSFKKKKEVDSRYTELVSTWTLEMQEQYYEYIQLMKIIVTGQSLKMGTLFIECTGEDTAIFKDEESKFLDYHNIHGLVEDEVEEQDLLISGIIHYAPSNIIVTNSSKLNEHILFAIKEIFKDRIKIQS